MQLLVVEDDLLLRNAMVRALRAEGFKVDDVENGKEGLLLAQQGIYDLILLDIMLPEMDGLSIIKELHDKSVMTLILLVTARDSVEDRVKGLDIGADDYLVKPFAMDELLARIRVLLRRHGKTEIQDELSYGPITVMKEKYDGFADGNKLNLTVKEYELSGAVINTPGANLD